jgi:pimeloyl-ACP methyl ester carboxylesterase
LTLTGTRIAYDRAGPRGGAPLVLVHAGIADRRMWDNVWLGLTAEHDVVRLDLRGYGESTARPEGPWSQCADVRTALVELDIDRAHLIGCSYGAGVCAELALQHPNLVASLLLAAPGGSLLAERTDDLARFLEAERGPLQRGDINAAVEANVVHWVDGPHRGPDAVPAAVRDAVREMQRRAFDITLPWPDAIWEAEEELAPEPARLADIAAPTLVLFGELDMDTVRETAGRLAAHVPDTRRVDWPDVAHLPSIDRPHDFVELTLGWVAEQMVSARAHGRT